MIRRPPRSTQSRSSAASDVYKRQVMETEIYSIVQKVAGGIEVTDETLALDVIKKVGSNGTYLAEKHTRAHMKEIWRPNVWDRTPYDLSLIHISEPTRLGMISYAVFCL